MDKLTNSPVVDWLRLTVIVAAGILVLKFLLSLVPVPGLSRLAAAI